MHPCFVPQVTLNVNDTEPPSNTEANMPSWNDCTIFTNLSGKPTLDRTADKPGQFRESTPLLGQRKLNTSPCTALGISPAADEPRISY